MEKDLIKKISLLKYYSKTGAEINLKIKNNPSLKINGLITDKNFFLGEKYIIIKNKLNNPIKIFIDEIVLESIIPEGYMESENSHKSSDKEIGSKETRSNNKGSDYSDNPGDTREEIKRRNEQSMFFRPK